MELSKENIIGQDNIGVLKYRIKFKFNIYTINNRISCLGFIILHTKISLHKFLNSLKYPYLLVK